MSKLNKIKEHVMKYYEKLFFTVHSGTIYYEQKMDRASIKTLCSESRVLIISLFHSVFYQKFWSVVDDVLRMVLGFLNGSGYITRD